MRLPRWTYSDGLSSSSVELSDPKWMYARAKLPMRASKDMIIITNALFGYLKISAGSRYKLAFTVQCVIIEGSTDPALTVMAPKRRPKIKA